MADASSQVESRRTCTTHVRRSLGGAPPDLQVTGERYPRMSRMHRRNLPLITDNAPFDRPRLSEGVLSDECSGGSVVRGCGRIRSRRGLPELPQWVAMMWRSPPAAMAGSATAIRNLLNFESISSPATSETPAMSSSRKSTWAILMSV